MEFRILRGGDRLLGGQIEADLPVILEPATRVAAERWKLDGWPADPVDAAKLIVANAVAIKRAGGVAKPPPEPVDAERLALADSPPSWARAQMEQLARSGQPINVTSLGFDPSTMTRGARTVADLMAEHQQKNPKIDMAVYRPPTPAIETPSTAVARSPTPPPESARLQDAVALARRTKDRLAVRALLDSYTGVAGAEADLVPADRADAFLAALEGLPEAAKPDASGTPARRIPPTLEDWSADDP
jgi:hypothetical protein